MKYPIKVLMDKDKKPFIPFVPTSAIVENGTGKTLEEILANLAVPIVNLTGLDSDSVSAMMTKMEQYKDIGFAIIYTDAAGKSKVYSFDTKTTADTLNKLWVFRTPAEPMQNTLEIKGYYNVDTKAFTTSEVNLINTHGQFNNGYYINHDIENKRPITIGDYAVRRKWTDFLCWMLDNQVCFPILYLTGGDGVTEPWSPDSDLDTFISSRPSSITLKNRDVGKTYKQMMSIGINWINGRPEARSVYISRYESFAYLNENTGLSKTNTKSYTPSKDYHPATKKYVDDSMKTIDLSDYATTEYVDEQLGDINAILATITTPEVSE